MFHMPNTEQNTLVGMLVRCLATCATRGISRVSQVSRNQSGLLNWHDIPIHSNKTVKVYG